MRVKCSPLDIIPRPLCSYSISSTVAFYLYAFYLSIYACGCQLGFDRAPKARLVGFTDSRAREVMALVFSYQEWALRPEKSRLPTKGHVFIIDWKNLFVMKHQSYYLKKLQLSNTL